MGILAAVQPSAPTSYSAADFVLIEKISAEKTVEKRLLSGGVAVVLPDRAQVQVRDGQGNLLSRLVADGKNTWLLHIPRPLTDSNGTTHPAGQATYRRLPLSEQSSDGSAPEGKRLSETLRLSGLVGPEFAEAITGGNPLAIVGKGNGGAAGGSAISDHDSGGAVGEGGAPTSAVGRIVEATCKRGIRFSVRSRSRTAVNSR